MNQNKGHDIKLIIIDGIINDTNPTLRNPIYITIKSTNTIYAIMLTINIFLLYNII
jgi:hypothetical protein